MTITKEHNCKEELKKAGLKVTPARLGVLLALEQADMPLDVATIISFLRKKNVKADKVTVFRILNLLTDKGITYPIQLNEGKFRYEHGSKGDHHHLVCENCGSIEDISDTVLPNLEKEIQEKYKFKVSRHSLEFFGLCRNCRN